MGLALLWVVMRLDGVGEVQVTMSIYQEIKRATYEGGRWEL